MKYPWLFIVGAMLVGWLVVEVLPAISRGTVRRVPLGMNLMAMVAFGLIAAAFVL